MVLEEYITDQGKHLFFKDENARCFGEIIIGFDCVFRATSTWEIGPYTEPFLVRFVVM
jgi:hypothetical protein